MLRIVKSRVYPSLIRVSTNPLPPLPLSPLSPSFPVLSTDSRCSHLQELVRKAQRRVDMLTSYVTAANGAGGKESEKQRTLWQRRLKLLNRMKVGFDQTRELWAQNDLCSRRALKPQ